GADPAASLADVVATASAASATHEELSRTRAELAKKNWQLILPDREAKTEQTSDFLLMGAVDPQTLAEVGRLAEEQAAKVRKLFKLPADQPLVKGRLTLFVFDKRYDYGEVGTMLERREIPATWRGHWRH